ncbi:calcium:cation antiporter [Myroides sp. LJL119]
MLFNNRIGSLKKTIGDYLSKKSALTLFFVWLMVAGSNFFSLYLQPDSLGIFKTGLLFIAVVLIIIIASFLVVKKAHTLAVILSEPYGTLILTLSIVSIEVILIVAVLTSETPDPFIAKNSIFSVMMIILNLIIGLCILLGANKFKELKFNPQGSFTYLGMILILASISMILPNYLPQGQQGIFTPSQSLFIAVLTFLLYGIFLWYQTAKYPKSYIKLDKTQQNSKKPTHHTKPGLLEHKAKKGLITRVVIHSILLVFMILPIAFLSDVLAKTVDYGISYYKLPGILSGVIIAVIVFTPESLTSIKAVLNNEFQRAINLCHGAFVSTVGLTIPGVFITSLVFQKTLKMGLLPWESFFFIVTLALSYMSLSYRRVTPIWGVMHLGLFLVFLMMLFVE